MHITALLLTGRGLRLLPVPCWELGVSWTCQYSFASQAADLQITCLSASRSQGCQIAAQRALLPACWRVVLLAMCPHQCCGWLAMMHSAKPGKLREGAGWTCCSSILLRLSDQCVLFAGGRQASI